MTFAKLGLAPPLLRALDRAGFTAPTPIQRQAIPAALQGRDLVGCAQTGTGKTAAFALPILQRLAADAPPRRPGIRALVLAPTRELAIQIGESLQAYGAGSGLRTAVVYGGVPVERQRRAIGAGAAIIVATPGRLGDLMRQGVVRLDRVEILVLDEADRMLDMGFLPEVSRIVAAVPRRRQTLMFSATMPEAIRRLADRWMTDPCSVQIAPDSAPADGVAQSVYFVEPPQKLDLLRHVLRHETCLRTLVFSRTRHGADRIVKRLKQMGVAAVALHGNKSQSAREGILERFRSPRPPVLVATDIAARGIDVEAISHVVNYDLPNQPETYVHRIGRTARAGRQGVAVSFCSSGERGQLQAIERQTGCRLAVVAPPAGLERAVAEPVASRAPAPAARPSEGGRAGRPRQTVGAAARPRRFGGRRGARPAISNRL